MSYQGQGDEASFGELVVDGIGKRRKGKRKKGEGRTSKLT